jgi:ATP-binding cassette subfamily F protein uup
MEETIAAEDCLVAELEETMAKPEVASDPQQLEACWQRLETARAEVDRLYQRWHDLEEKKGE